MTKTVTVTGAAGQIGYALLFRLAAGAVYGDEPLHLRLLEVESAVASLEGVVMELEDCAFPTLASVTTTADPEVAFAGADLCLLVGARPRSKGMSRGDLLEANGTIFAAQGAAIGRHASPDVKVLVTGNPANTNALIAASHATGVPAENITALTRLDHDRALARIARRTGRPVSELSRVVIWGNHSASQVPDLTHALAGSTPVTDLVDAEWAHDAFVTDVANRGSAIIESRGGSSVGSAANATLSHARDWVNGTAGRWVSMGVVSHGEYGVPAGLVSSFPCTVDADGTWHIVEGLDLDPVVRERLAATSRELEDERDTAARLGLLGA